MIFRPKISLKLRYSDYDHYNRPVPGPSQRRWTVEFFLPHAKLFRITGRKPHAIGAGEQLNFHEASKRQMDCWREGSKRQKGPAAPMVGRLRDKYGDSAVLFLARTWAVPAVRRVKGRKRKIRPKSRTRKTKNEKHYVYC